MNELIDEAIGRVMAQIKARGWDEDTDVIFTTDHGELQGDFGFVYKGPFHVDALMRLPFIWRPAPNAKVKPATVEQPVEQVDLAATFCAIAGVEQAEWMQGKVLPTSDDGSRQRALCEWDSQFPGYGFHFRSIYRDGFMLTRYEAVNAGTAQRAGRILAAIRAASPATSAMTAAKASYTISTTIPCNGKTSGTIPNSAQLKKRSDRRSLRQSAAGARNEAESRSARLASCGDSASQLAATDRFTILGM